jgi:hypothetical protein
MYTHYKNQSVDAVYGELCETCKYILREKYRSLAPGTDGKHSNHRALKC